MNDKLNRIDFGKLGFDDYQVNDLKILFSLQTPDQKMEWMNAVGQDGLEYGITLLELAALALLDEDVQTENHCKDARAALAKIMYS